VKWVHESGSAPGTRRRQIVAYLACLVISAVRAEAQATVLEFVRTAASAWVSSDMPFPTKVQPGLAIFQGIRFSGSLPIVAEISAGVLRVWPSDARLDYTYRGFTAVSGAASVTWSFAERSHRIVYGAGIETALSFAQYDNTVSMFVFPSVALVPIVRFHSPNDSVHWGIRGGAGYHFRRDIAHSASLELAASISY